MKKSNKLNKSNSNFALIKVALYLDNSILLGYKIA
ncbi:hypothetical protein BD412_002131 [Thermoanaerobacterium thermosaccharolyticum]|nr:hypothetical protein [Thermoanaerobacterium thermosaccharolyticum]